MTDLRTRSGASSAAMGDLGPDRFQVVAERPGRVWFRIPSGDGLVAWVAVEHQAEAPEGWAACAFEACDAEIPGPTPDPKPGPDAPVREFDDE